MASCSRRSALQLSLVDSAGAAQHWTNQEAQSLHSDGCRVLRVDGKQLADLFVGPECTIAQHFTHLDGNGTLWMEHIGWNTLGLGGGGDAPAGDMLLNAALVAAVATVVR
jgi:hypothetical protein